MRTLRLLRLFSTASIATLIAAGIGLNLPAFADPPDHAPAHGWRKKHDPDYVGYTGHKWERDYGIIAGRCDRKAIGTVLGAVAGGVIGSQVADRDDRPVAILIGAVIGAVVGREIGRSMDDRDFACVGHALELARDGQRVRWTNETTGVSYVLKPFVGERKGTCRSFELTVSRGGTSRIEKRRACRSGEGTWKMDE